MKTVSLYLVLWLASVSVAWTQTAGITVEVMLDQDQYLAAEELRVAVRITNRSGRTLQLGEDENWLTFHVEASDNNRIVQKFGNPDVAGEFPLDSSMMVTKRADIAPYFDLRRVGRYRVTAKVKIPQLNHEAASPPKSFYIVNGTKLKVIEFGVPPSDNAANEPLEMRKYILQQTQFGKEMKLYLRLTDETEAKVFKVFPLARMVSFSQPEVQLDRFSNLHVLLKYGQKAFSYSEVNPQGQIVTRQTHEDSAKSRPHLRVQENGRIGVSGGVRRASQNDLPPPEFTSSPATNPGNNTDARTPTP